MSALRSVTHCPSDTATDPELRSETAVLSYQRTEPRR